ncbi:MAG: hypothetical protein P9M15_05895 [Candidatus Electryoneaceae bacterium]|nr:hypothetical protein [Candidatus Electryoneaceae bacterium]
MAKNKPVWLTKLAMEELGEVWQDRVVVLLRDLSQLPHLRYAYIVSKDGNKLTETIGPGEKIVEGNDLNPKMFSDLARYIEEYFINIEHPAPAQLISEFGDDLLFIGSTGEVILVAFFDGEAPRGYMSMKLSKRMMHLRKLYRTMEIGSLNV